MIKTHILQYTSISDAKCSIDKITIDKLLRTLYADSFRGQPAHRDVIRFNILHMLTNPTTWQSMSRHQKDAKTREGNAQTAYASTSHLSTQKLTLADKANHHSIAKLQEII